jgi:hypothetical protein
MRLPKIALAAASITFAFSSTAAQAAYCQPGTSGCVLPLPGPGPTVSVPVSTVAEPMIEEAGGGIGLLPILIALAALGIGAYFLLDDDGDVVSP